MTEAEKLKLRCDLKKEIDSSVNAQILTLQQKISERLDEFAGIKEQLKCFRDKDKMQVDVIADITDKVKGLDDLTKKVNEMHTIFTKSNWAIKLVIRIFGGIGIIAGGCIGFRELFLNK